jgi:hypothetical protein
VSAPHLLRVRCVTWDQVEAFYAHKLRRGRLLTMRVPFEPALNEAMTLGVELPNQMVIAIDGTVSQVGQRGAGDKIAVELNLHGLTPEILARLKLLVAEGRTAAPAPRTDRRAPSPGPGAWGAAAPGRPAAVTASDVGVPVRPGSVTPLAPPPPPPDDSEDDEDTELGGAGRAVFDALDAELRRMRELAAHEVLGVDWDAEAAEVRAAWIGLGRRFHPDVVARYRARILRDVSEELTIHVNRAYDRMRAALVADGRAAAFGPALHPPRGWLVGWEDLATGGDIHVLAPEPAHVPPRQRTTVRFESAPLRGEDLFGDLGAEHAGDGATALPHADSAGQSFEKQARARLALGDHATAREILAAALHVYPRNAPLRALYHVASAMGALEGGQHMLATSQLEAALVQDPDCREAATALEGLRGRNPDGTLLRRLFR